MNIQDLHTARRMLRKAKNFRSLAASSTTASRTGKEIALWTSNYYGTALKRFIATRI